MSNGLELFWIFVELLLNFAIVICAGGFYDTLKQKMLLANKTCKFPPADKVPRLGFLQIKQNINKEKS